jgi:hypothetical protein
MATQGLWLRAAALCAVAGWLTACDIPHEVTGPTEREDRSVEAGNVESATAEIHMSAGELHIAGGAEKLLDGEFAYNVPSWKPVIRYNASGFRGHLVVEQKKTTGSIGNTVNRWNLRLNEKIPIELELHLGAGESRLSLGRMNLRGLQVHIGAGHIDLDLRGGDYRHNFPVAIHGGVGECDVRVPRGTGVSAEVHGGIGGINTTNFSKRPGSIYVNDAYDTAPVKISLQIHGGIGQVRLFSE